MQQSSPKTRWKILYGKRYWQPKLYRRIVQKWEFLSILDMWEKLFLNFKLIPAGLHSIVLYGSEPTTEATPTVAAADLTLCIGLGLAFVIFTAVLCVIVKLLRRKNENYPSYGLSSGGKMTFFYLFLVERSDKVHFFDVDVIKITSKPFYQ